MIDFNVNQKTCTKCSQCSSDCPARIITMEGGYPAISQKNEANCYRCQHCGQGVDENHQADSSLV